jgi:hypothetical protein
MCLPKGVKIPLLSQEILSNKLSKAAKNSSQVQSPT